MATQQKKSARYESARTYGGSQAQSDDVVRVAPSGAVQTIARFPVDDKSGRKADDYASELQRETRGYKAGGSVKGWGKARSARACKVR